ncbi:MAG: efflux RND transporter permease subunit [Phycisphaeraceae bacterium]
MDPIRFAIDNPVKVAVGVILLLLFGVIALVRIPVQLTPEVDKPIITVETDWVGRSPEEVEREVLEPQEDVLKDIGNLRKMTATARLGQGSIELEFFVGTEIKDARQEVSDSLREVADYPEEVEEPVIQEGETAAESPIAWLILTSESSDPDFDIQALGNPAEERIKPYLERVPGVSEVRVYGGREYELAIELDPQKIAQRGITFNELSDALRLANINISGGEVAEGHYDVRIRTVGQYDLTEQVARTIVAYGEGGPIRIGDLGKVSQSYVKQRSFVRSRGEFGLALPVYRQSGANVISIMEGTRTVKGLRQRIDEVNRDILPRVARVAQEDLGLTDPPELNLRQVYDETVYIYDALALVRNNLFLGGSFAVMSLLLFLRAVRPTIVVALAIPISVVGTFVAMAAFGRNINVISLAGLAFAVGMVVDNAIVVLENIDRHLGMGKKPMAAAYDATKEVWGAILASTLTTLVVFVPILTIEAEAGQLFRDIALAIVAAVALSLLVSITVIPTSTSRFLRNRGEPATRVGQTLRSLGGLTPLFAKAGRKWADTIYSLTRPNAEGVFARIAVVGVITAAALVVSSLIMPPADYLPRGNQNLVFGVLITPPGYNLDHDEQIAMRAETLISPYWEAEDYADLAAQSLPAVTPPMQPEPVTNLPPIQNYFFVSFGGGTFHGATSKDKNNVEPLAGLLQWAGATQVPGVISIAQQSSIFGRGLGGTRSIDVEVAGNDLASVRDSADALYQRLAEEYGFDKVRPQPGNFNIPAPELRVVLDEVKAKELGIDTTALGRGVQALVDGLFVGEFRYRGELIDIRAKRDRSIELMPEQLGDLPLAYHVAATGESGTIHLSDVADSLRGDSPQEIRRIEERRAVTLNVTPPDDVPLEQATNDIRATAAEMREAGEIDPGISIDYAGSASDLEEVREAMLGSWKGFNADSLLSLGLSRIFIALLVTYLLMAALFESWLYPFVVMFAVPLATVGGFIGLAAMHAWNPQQQLDVLTMLGFVILIGIVVNNAILIVHQALNFMRGVGEGEGDDKGVLGPREAIRASVRSRIRPIFMTTFTSVCGMLPLVLMPGSGSELYKGLGSVVVGGLLFATIFTLLVTPLLLSLVFDAQAWFARRLGKDENAIVTPAGV